MELKLARTISNLLVLLFKSLYIDIESFFSSAQFFLQTFSTKWDHFWRISSNKPLPCNIQTYEGQEEMNMMMNRVGMVCGFEGTVNENAASFSAEDLVSLFEEEEPSLDEIKETFGVFDVNKDGFIDASELQRVVCNLGLKEGYEVEVCKRMIEAFDCNGDGLIDFQEFVMFMEKCLC